MLVMIIKIINNKPRWTGAIPGVLTMNFVELCALELQSVDTALVVHVEHGSVEDLDVSVEGNVGSSWKTRDLVRLIKFVLVTVVLEGEIVLKET